MKVERGRKRYFTEIVTLLNFSPEKVRKKKKENEKKKKENGKSNKLA